MCSASQVADPMGLTYKYKWADPLGATKTAAGDPTGVFRKGHAEEAAYNQSWADYNNAQGGMATGGGATGESLRTVKRNKGGAFTMLGA
jgi:hypothetical protein